MEPIMVATDVGLKQVQEMVSQPDEELKYYKDKLEEIKLEIYHRETELKELFAVEQARKQQLETWLKELQQQRYHLQMKVNILSSPHTSWIPLDPLLWRNEKTKLPSLVLFNLNTPTAGFSVAFTRTNYPYLEKTGVSVSVHNDMPRELSKFYEDLRWVLSKPPYIPSLEEVSQANQQTLILRVTTSFEGMIPSDVRKKIRAALDSKVFAEKIYLLCEVESWGLQYTEPKPNPVRYDPLVVGWSSIYPDRLWYIDAFDISPLENRVPIVI